MLSVFDKVENFVWQGKILVSIILFFPTRFWKGISFTGIKTVVVWKISYHKDLKLRSENSKYELLLAGVHVILVLSIKGFTINIFYDRMDININNNGCFNLNKN